MRCYWGWEFWGRTLCGSQAPVVNRTINWAVLSPVVMIHGGIGAHPFPPLPIEQVRAGPIPITDFLFWKGIFKIQSGLGDALHALLTATRRAAGQRDSQVDGFKMGTTNDFAIFVTHSTCNIMHACTCTHTDIGHTCNRRTIAIN